MPRIPSGAHMLGSQSVCGLAVSPTQPCTFPGLSNPKRRIAHLSELLKCSAPSDRYHSVRQVGHSPPTPSAQGYTGAVGWGRERKTQKNYSPSGMELSTSFLPGLLQMLGFVFFSPGNNHLSCNSNLGGNFMAAELRIMVSQVCYLWE